MYDYINMSTVCIEEWGHIAAVRGHKLAYVIGFQPSISRTGAGEKSGLFKVNLSYIR